MTAYIVWYILTRLIIFYRIHNYLKRHADEITDDTMASTGILTILVIIPVVSDAILLPLFAIVLTALFLQGVCTMVGSYYRKRYGNKKEK